MSRVNREVQKLEQKYGCICVCVCVCVCLSIGRDLMYGYGLIKYIYI